MNARRSAARRLLQAGGMKSFLLILVVLAAAPARAAELVLAGRIDRVVAAGPLVAVVRGQEVRVLAEDGRSLLRLGTAHDERARDGHAAERRALEALEAHGISEEDRDSEYGEAVIEDEASLRDRPAEPLGAEPWRRPVLAASEHELWIADGHTLWRVGADERARPAATLTQRFDHLAVAPDGRLIAAAGARVWQSHDGGLTFQRLAEAGGPVRALAAGQTRVAWAAGGQLTWLDTTGTSTLPFGRASDLQVCGAALLALGPRGLLVVSPKRKASGSRLQTSGPEPDPATVPIRSDLKPGAGSLEPEETTTAAAEGWRLACAGATWVLVGHRLLVSTDEGRTFTARSDLPPAVILDGAVGQRCLWVGTTGGLFCLSDRPAASPLAAGPTSGIWLTGRAHWAPFLPRLTVATSALISPGRRDVRALVYADFPVGSAAARALPAPRLMAQVEAAQAAEPAIAAAGLPPDREASCLPVVRAQAVSRSLVEPERARSYVARASHAAWLPELRVLAARRLGRSESLDLPAGGSVAPGPLGLDTANDVRYEARATWDLSKLVFSTDEIAAATTALRMADMRREVESLANRLYFERRRLKVEGLATDTRARRDLRILELEAELDAISGGAFTRCLPAPP